MKKQYIEWFNSAEEAWNFVIEYAKILRDNDLVGTHSLGVEYCKGDYWVVLKRK